MRTPQLFLALVLVAPVFAGCLGATSDVLDTSAAPAMAGVDADGFAPRVFTDGFVFGTLDAIVDPTLTVHADLYLPLADKPLDASAAVAADKFPTVLVMSPYFGAGQGGDAPGHPVYGYLVDHLVPRGYAVVLADVAGTGGSSGCWDFMGPQEVRSVAAMIDHIAAQPWSDGNVGMIGKSYDAMTQIMATVANPAALKTIVPVAPLTHAYAGLYQNGVHYGGGWHATTTSYHLISATPPAGAEERYPGYATRTVLTPPCLAQNTALGNDPSGSYNLYFQERDFRPLASSVAPSVFFMQGFLDPAVKPDNMFPWFNDVQSPKKAWIGHWNHDYANATWAGREDMFVTMHRWFDHELKGIENGILDEPVFDVQDSLGRWRHESTWPPQDAQTLRLYAGVGKLVSTTDDPAGGMSFGGPTSLLEGDALRLPVEGIDGPLHVAGIPRVTLTLASDRPGGYVVAKLIDVGAPNGERLVAQGAFNLQFTEGLGAPRPLVPGQDVTATFDLYPTDYALAAATDLVLQLQTVDDALWYDPDPTGATLTLRVGGESSYLEIPTVQREEASFFLTACGTRIKDAVPECYQDGRVDLVPEASA